MSNTVVYITEPIMAAATLGEQLCYQITEDSVQQGSLEQTLVTLRGKPVTLVLSAADVTLTQVALNRKQARHIQSVLPFILEESLLASPETLWFSHQTPKRGETQYPVVVCEQAGLERLYHYCKEQECYITGVFVDAHLWQHRAPTLIKSQETALLMPSAYQGLVVDEALLEASTAALGVNSEDFSLLSLSDELLQELAQGALDKKGVNLLHSALAPMVTSAQQHVWQSWKPTVMFAASILVIIGGLLLFQTHQYQQAAQGAQRNAIALYQELFPQASRPQLLQREFENQLRRLQNAGSSESAFLRLMTPVAQQLSSNEFKQAQPLRFQFDEREASLSFDITAPQFAQIEQLRSQLQAEGMKVSIGNSRSAEGGVTARLKVEVAS